MSIVKNVKYRKKATVIFVSVLLIFLISFVVRSAFIERGVKPIQDISSDQIEYKVPVRWKGTDDLKGYELSGVISIGAECYEERSIRADLFLVLYPDGNLNNFSFEEDGSLGLVGAKNGNNGFWNFQVGDNLAVLDDFMVFFAKPDVFIQYGARAGHGYVYKYPSYKCIFSFQGVIEEKDFVCGVTKLVWNFKNSKWYSVSLKKNMCHKE